MFVCFQNSVVILRYSHGPGHKNRDYLAKRHSMGESVQLTITPHFKLGKLIIITQRTLKPWPIHRSILVRPMVYVLNGERD